VKKISSYFNSGIKKIPIPLAFLVSLISLAGGIFLISKSQVIFSKASTENVPHNIKISNISGTLFIVSWTTKEKTTGSIIYGEDSALKNSKNDLRDENQAKQQELFTHFVVADELTPQTKYYFKIVSGDRAYDQTGKLFEITTALAKLPPDNDLAQGKILQSDGQPASEAIVYLSLPNSIVQASLTDENGRWMIPLASARTSDLQNFSNYDRSAQIEEIFVQGRSLTASATLTTNNDNPAPDIALGQTYNFQNETTITPSQNTPTDAVSFIQPGEGSGFQTIEAEEDLSILFPSQNENINSPKPEFFGKGPKNSPLSIEIQSEEKITAEAEVDQNGRWQWSSSQPLSPGEHTITVSFVDKDGFIKKVSRNFIVLAAGESNLPSFTATPSGEKATPTPKPTTKLTATPTPSITNIQKISPTDKPVRTTIPSGTPPKSGTSLPTWIFFGGGVTVIIVGAILFLL